MSRRDRLNANQLNHQDPFILRHGLQPTANRLPLLSRGDLCDVHCSVLVRMLDTFASRSTPTARRLRTCGGVKTHKAASLIQATYRGIGHESSILDRCFNMEPSSQSLKHGEYMEVHNILFPVRPSTSEKLLLSGFNFVMVGAVPNHKKKWTHTSLEKEVQALGGTISKALPGCTKGRSTKT